MLGDIVTALLNEPIDNDFSVLRETAEAPQKKFDLAGMRSQEPDADALRALFSELEFASMLKDLMPSSEEQPDLLTEVVDAKDAATLLAKVEEWNRLERAEGDFVLGVALSTPSAALSATPSTAEEVTGHG